MELNNLHQTLIKSSTYVRWRKSYPSHAKAYEAFVAAILRGERPKAPSIVEYFGAFLIGFASSYISEQSPAPEPTPEPSPTPEPTPTIGLSYPKDAMELFHRDGGLAPAMITNGFRCELKSAGLSRVHWSATRMVGETFRIGATVTYGSGFRGVIMRVENNTSDNTNLHQLELGRFRDGLWYVSQRWYRSPLGDQNNDLFGGLYIPQGATVEMRGKISNIHGEALTELLINGVVVGKSTNANWATNKAQVMRQRFGVVAGDSSQATVIEILHPYFV